MDMDIVELLPRLHPLRFAVGQAYLWCDGDELTLVDAGARGAGAPVAEAIASLGGGTARLRRIVLTHFHEDHAGGAAELAAASGAEVLAHRLDATVVLGELPGPPPVFEDWERPLHTAAAARLPQGRRLRPARVTGLSEGDTVAFGGGARVLHVAGHTYGSIALHLPRHGVLFTGDAVAASPVDGAVLPGVFHLDRSQTLASFHRLAALDTEVACFGHGEPVTARAGTVLRGGEKASRTGLSGTRRREASRRMPPGTHVSARPHGGARQPTGTPASRYTAAPRSRARSAQRRRS